MVPSRPLNDPVRLRLAVRIGLRGTTVFLLAAMAMAVATDLGSPMVVQSMLATGLAASFGGFSLLMLGRARVFEKLGTGGALECRITMLVLGFGSALMTLGGLCLVLILAALVGALVSG